jgi:hypothetical protein
MGWGIGMESAMSAFACSVPGGRMRRAGGVKSPEYNKHNDPLLGLYGIEIRDIAILFYSGPV